jgi:hypothetical protein
MMSEAAAQNRAPFWVLLLGVAVVLGLISLPLWTSQSGGGDVVFFTIAFSYFLVLGVLILKNAPGNRIGWLFALMALSIGLSGVLGAIGDLGYLTFSTIAGTLWLFWIGLVPLLFLWFPTGRVPTPRWRILEVGIFLAIGLTALSSLFTEFLCAAGDAGECREWVSNPLGIPGVPHPEYSGPIGVLLILAMVTSVVAVLWRYRGSNISERLQLKWFLLAISLFAVAVLAEIVFELVFGVEAPGWVGVMNAVGIIAIPVSATIAILRYRLYEIDRIISRTLSYAVVVGLLGLMVAAVATIAGAQFDEPWVVAATTLGVAAMFNPVRRRVQGWVDRRFNRSRYNAQRVMDEFAGALRDRVDSDEVVRGWLGVVDATMQPETIGVWLRV